MVSVHPSEDPTVILHLYPLLEGELSYYNLIKEAEANDTPPPNVNLADYVPPQETINRTTGLLEKMGMTVELFNYDISVSGPKSRLEEIFDANFTRETDESGEVPVSYFIASRQLTIPPELSDYIEAAELPVPGKPLSPTSTS